MKLWQSVALGLLVMSPIFSTRLTPGLYEGGRSRDEHDREARNSSALATILGEVRTNMSDLMFIKTERYLHAGVAYMPHIDMDEIASSGEIADKPKGSMDFAAKFVEHEAEAAGTGDDHDHHDHDGHDHDHEHGSPGTLIPPPESDFRGLVGVMQRAVKPWQDPSQPHVHTTGKELLPWYRLMTLTDPHNVRGYLIGAWWLKSQSVNKDLDEALKFVQEGIANNPRAFALKLLEGNILKEKERTEEARLAYRAAAELALEARPHERVQPFIDEDKSITLPDWTDYNEEDARAAIRMAVLSEREYGSTDEALRLALRYNEGFLGDGRLRILIEELEGGGPPAP
ncbi:hypothetical protein GC173_10130 [bacterium]|nr:hypothetical protein [bacterium]